MTEEGHLTINCVCNVHSVVEKGIEGDLWGRLRVRLWPCDVQDECFGVLKVSYLWYKIEGKTRYYNRVNPNSFWKVFKYQWRTMLRLSLCFNMMCILLKLGVGETQVIAFFKVDLDSTEDRTHPKLKGHWTDFLETLIPLIDGAKSLQLHLWFNKISIDRLVWYK